MWNPPKGKLYDLAIKNDNCTVTSHGALACYSGEKTGRCPSVKRILYDSNTKNIWWGNPKNQAGSDSLNYPINKELFNHYWDYARKQVCDGLENNIRKTNPLYIMDVCANWDPNYRLRIRLYTKSAYHALFVSNMFEVSDCNFDTFYGRPDHTMKPDFTIYDVSHLSLEEAGRLPKPEGHLNKPEGHLNKPEGHEDLNDWELTDSLVALDFTDNRMIIYGTKYAGEIKKGILTYMMYSMPKKGQLTLHSSCNIGSTLGNLANVALFFGLSGTGKTSLSADSGRRLIGDDEHVWTDSGVFNVEYGCYAKLINLDPNHEPEIYQAVNKFGTIVENIILDDNNNIKFEDSTITQNTRGSYPLTHVRNAHIPATTCYHPRNIILLTCDVFGVMPPVAKLNYDQAIQFFINGYTSKIPGTETTITEPEMVFSPCFGKPFLIWHPFRYGEILKQKLEKRRPNVWLVNTGWTGGSYQTGHRISIKHSRSIVEAIHSGTLSEWARANTNYWKFPYFGWDVPKNCPNVPENVLNPSNNWENKDEYDKTLKHVFDKFTENYAKLESTYTKV